MENTSLVECSIDTKEEKKFDNHYDVVEKVKNLFEKEANQRELERQFLEKIKEQIIQRLKLAGRGKPQAFKEKIDELINKIENSRLKTNNKRELRSALRKYGKEPEELVEEISSIVSNLPSEPRLIIQQHYAEVILSASLKK